MLIYLIILIAFDHHVRHCNKLNVSESLVAHCCLFEELEHVTVHMNMLLFIGLRQKDMCCYKTSALQRSWDIVFTFYIYVEYWMLDSWRKCFIIEPRRVYRWAFQVSKHFLEHLVTLAFHSGIVDFIIFVWWNKTLVYVKLMLCALYFSRAEETLFLLLWEKFFQTIFLLTQKLFI